VRDSRTMAGMRRISKPSPTESPLLFEVDPKPLEESLTALGGIPLVVQAFRSLGLPGTVQRHVAVKERERGYDEATFVESFVILNAAGGECVDDFAHLRSDAGWRSSLDMSCLLRKRRGSFCTPSTRNVHRGLDEVAAGLEQYFNSVNTTATREPR
jgi:hypothetical protein